MRNVIVSLPGAAGRWRRLLWHLAMWQMSQGKAESEAEPFDALRAKSVNGWSWYAPKLAYYLRICLTDVSSCSIGGKI